MKQRAFTLVEEVIVLALGAVILALASPQLVRSRQVAAERQFFTRLSAIWTLQTNRARINGRRMRVSANDQEMKVGETVIELPATLTPTNFACLEIGKDGFVAPHTRVLKSSIDHSRYVLKIQMGWGGYRVKKVAGWD